MSFSEIQRTHCGSTVPAFLSPDLLILFLPITPQRKLKKKNQHIVLMYELKKNLFFFSVEISFLDSENRRMLFLREKYFFILVASY